MAAVAFNSQATRTALSLAVFWTAACAALAWAVAQHYFPLGDDWALIADAAQGPSLSWWTQGFSGYFTVHPGFVAVWSNFIRPLMNAVYWVSGVLLPLDSGWRLLPGWLAIGVLSGLIYLAMIRAGADRWVALALAALSPLLPSLLSARSGVIYFPFFAFDPLVACLCLLAWLQYQAGRWVPTALCLLLALLTKETAVPVAVALPLHAVLRADQPRRGKVLALLLAPLLCWVALRWQAFGSLTGGTYAMSGGWLQLLERALLERSQKLPFVPQYFSTAALRHGMLALNLVLMLSAVGFLIRRLWQRRNPEAAEWVLVLSYLFLLINDGGPRLGVVLGAFLLLSVASWCARAEFPRVSYAVAALLMLGLVLQMQPAWKVRQTFTAQLVAYQGIAPGLVAVLRAVPADQPVLVLNDPVSWYVRAEHLRHAAGIAASVTKATDFSCNGAPNNLQKINQPCDVRFEQTGPQQVRFEQSCGLEVCGAIAGAWAPQPVLNLPDGTRATLFLSTEGAKPQWGSMQLELPPGPRTLVYFEPGTRTYVSRNLP